MNTPTNQEHSRRAATGRMAARLRPMPVRGRPRASLQCDRQYRISPQASVREGRKPRRGQRRASLHGPQPVPGRSRLRPELHGCQAQRRCAAVNIPRGMWRGGRAVPASASGNAGQVSTPQPSPDPDRLAGRLRSTRCAGRRHRRSSSRQLRSPCGSCAHTYP
jgi:hypothetical protein